MLITTGPSELQQLCPRLLLVLLSTLNNVLMDCRQPITVEDAYGTDMHGSQANGRFTLSMTFQNKMCYLDAKQAFDGVNHWTLAKKLLEIS